VYDPNPTFTEPPEPPGSPYALWSGLSERQGDEQLVHAAVLAASAHNTQPWQFRRIGERLEILADLERNLGTFDPFRRELFQSIGCAAENCRIVARAQGLEGRVEALPGKLPPPPDGTCAVILHLTPGFEVVPANLQLLERRRTHRGAFESWPPSEVVLSELPPLAADFPRTRLTLFTGARATALGALIVEATREIVADARMAADNSAWFRFRNREIQRRGDGLTLDPSTVSPFQHFLARYFPPSGKKANRQWLVDTEKVHVGTASAFGVISVQDPYDRPTAIEVGRLWQRLQLRLTQRGLASQPLHQPLERADRELQLGTSERWARRLGAFGAGLDWKPTFVFRLGVAKHPAGHSPRRPLDAVLH
jgi:hypothetical protein